MKYKCIESCRHHISPDEADWQAEFLTAASKGTRPKYSRSRPKVHSAYLTRPKFTRPKYSRSQPKVTRPSQSNSAKVIQGKPIRIRPTSLGQVTRPKITRPKYSKSRHTSLGHAIRIQPRVLDQSSFSQGFPAKGHSAKVTRSKVTRPKHSASLFGVGHIKSDLAEVI